ncbi:hypothetical protein [Fimbriimonas ginsengisoli]|uniref:DUF3108 domain-containing protein n=1 Tax=Fimbriimonas ginsengisoli Gsoil 348 TaxID=661478 RepID=A0A068NN05_FIMGI|nr:hypothetical protein [Fimbriimonas ginsengisoli]AIE84105.1 hypothetical protein OP10G_0737 [Fimbriimonas ginsengisoli Gsoil 348]
MIATLLVTGLLVAPRQDAWEIKPTFAKDKTITWKLDIDADLGGNQHKAKMDMLFTPGEAAENGDRKTKIEWQHVEMDGNEQELPANWQATVAKDGSIREALDPADDDYRRFLSIFSFSYPDKAVKVGDKWTLDLTPKAKDAKKMSYTFEAKEVEKVGGKEALKVISTQKEDKGDLTSDGTWWIGRDGAVLKMKLVVKKWIVPFAGADAFDATIIGETKEVK